MFCNQCEQTAKGQGCTVRGVCGKPPEVAALQDLLIHAIKGLSLYAHEGRKKGLVDPDVNVFTVKGLFSTLTNVNFDAADFEKLIKQCADLTARFKEKVAAAGGNVEFSDPSASFQPARDLEGLIRQGQEVGMASDSSADADIQSLQQALLFGIKGISAYADHAYLLGKEDDRVFAFIHEGLAALTDKSLGLEDGLKLVLRCGETNLLTMELLDAGHTETFGHPVPTEVPLGHKKGKCILVSVTT